MSQKLGFFLLGIKADPLWVFFLIVIFCSILLDISIFPWSTLILEFFYIDLFNKVLLLIEWQLWAFGEYLEH